jgi:signal transduction histidine kinase/ligand-binding sensor domain-containing protein
MICPDNIALRLRILLLMLLLVAASGILAQHYQVRTYTEADGIANSMAFDIAQDSSRVLWIARRSGITSYDGSTFTNYNVSDGLRSTSYSFLVVDKKKILWALIESGQLFVSKYQGPAWVTISDRNNLVSTLGTTYSAFEVFYLKDSCVLLAGSASDGLFIHKDGRWHKFTVKNGLPANGVNCLKEKDGKVYIGTQSGLGIFTSDGFRKLPVPGDPLLREPILAFYQFRDTLWLLGKNWFGYLSDNHLTVVSTGFSIPNTRLTRRYFFVITPRGKAFFGNPFNVFYYDPATGQTDFLTRSTGLISEGANAAIVDAEQNLWFAGFRGLTKIPSERFWSFTSVDGLYSNEVASAMELSPGKYVFGHDCALTFYDGTEMTHLLLNPDGCKENYESRVMDVDKDQEGNLWAAVSMMGVARVDRNRKVTLFGENQGIEGVAYSLVVTPDGKIFAGTSGGLYQYENGRFVKIMLRSGPSFSVRRIISGQDNTLFLGTLSRGLIELKGDQEISYQCSRSKLENNVYAYFVDSRQRRLVGTAGGLCEIVNNELVKVNRDGLAISRPVYVILEDNRKNLWVGTDNGVYRWNGARLDHFTVRDGLSGHDINRDAGFIDHRNHIWFGTNNGLTVLRPEFDYDITTIPPPAVSLQFVKAGHDTLDPQKKKSVSYDTDDFTFCTRVISLIDEKQVYVSYYLEGADTGWSAEIPYKGSSFVYNSLKPGTYRFFIKARNSIGIWSEPVSSASFTVRNPFWFSGWFLATASLLFFGIVFLAARFFLVSRYKNRLKEEVDLQTMALRQSENELMVSNAAKDRFFSIIAHDLRSPFNVILGYLDLLVTDYDGFTDLQRQDILSKLKSSSASTIDLLENLLTWAQAQRGLLPFNPEVIRLGDIINENMQLFGSAASHKQIRLEARCAEGLHVFADRNMLSTSLRNLISNAIKFTYPEGVVTLSCSHNDPGFILVEVKDTGMGIEASGQADLFRIEKRMVKKGTANERGTGLGLILCKEFIEKNGGRLWVESEKGAGSAFFFTLPAAKAVANNLSTS